MAKYVQVVKSYRLSEAAVLFQKLYHTVGQLKER